MKCFKYFDLSNNGTLEPDEFAKAIEKIGIMIPTKQVSQTKDFLVSSAFFIQTRFFVLFKAGIKFYFRTWIPYLHYTTLIKMVQSITKSLLSAYMVAISHKAN